MAAPEGRLRSAAVVLVVDDEEDVRTSIKSLIETEVPGVEVLLAAGGPQALDLLAETPVRLILCDHRMPGMDGLSFLEEVQRRSPGTPAIMITAYPDPGIAARAVQELGVGILIAKPMDLDYLVSMVQAVVEGRLGARTPAPTHPVP